MCTANKDTQGDVAQTTVTKFGSTLFPHKGANGDVNQIRLIKGKKKKATTLYPSHNNFCIAEPHAGGGGVVVLARWLLYRSCTHR